MRRHYRQRYYFLKNSLQHSYENSIYADQMPAKEKLPELSDNDKQYFTLCRAILYATELYRQQEYAFVTTLDVIAPSCQFRPNILAGRRKCTGAGLVPAFNSRHAWISPRDSDLWA